MTVNISMLAGAGAQFFDNNGDPLTGGKLYSYAAGTTTPQVAYTTSAGNVAHSNPIILDSAGRVPSSGEIWLTDAASYKFVVHTSDNVLIGTYDNITGNGSGIYAAFAASSGSSLIGFVQSGAGAVTRTQQSKDRDTTSIKDYGAVCDGSTDDTAAIQLALDSGAKIVDFLGLSSKCDAVTVPAGVSCINLNLLKKTAGGSILQVNTGCHLQGKVTGTGTLSIVERGVYPAANDVTDVTFDLECVDLTYGVHAQPPVSGVAYADAPKRWSGDLRFTDIAGTTGVSEGYGLLLSPAYHCQFNVISKSPNARHVIYISAGASYNQINANINGCTNYAAQIFATSPQPYCEYNTLNLTCFSLTETVAGQSGAIAIVGQANFNTATINMSGGGAVSYAALIEGGSGGPYPAGNKIINSSIYGQFTGADVIRMINADGTIIEGNTFACYAANYVIAMRRVGTNGASNAGFIEGNTINGLGQNVKGIYNECNAQPSWIGPNQIQANGTSLRVDDQSGGYRQGFSRRATFSGTTASIAGVSSGDTTATLLTPIQTTGRRTNVVTTGSSGTYFNSAICLVGVTAPGSETSATFRLYNGAAGAQTFNYEGVVEGD